MYKQKIRTVARICSHGSHATRTDTDRQTHTDARNLAVIVVHC